MKITESELKKIISEEVYNELNNLGNDMADLIILCEKLTNKLYEKRAAFATTDENPSLEFERLIRDLKRIMAAGLEKF